jgi:hypothetical protein
LIEAEMGSASAAKSKLDHDLPYYLLSQRSKKIDFKAVAL